LGGQIVLTSLTSSSDPLLASRSMASAREAPLGAVSGMVPITPVQAEGWELNRSAMAKLIVRTSASAQSCRFLTLHAI